MDALFYFSHTTILCLLLSLLTIQATRAQNLTNYQMTVESSLIPKSGGLSLGKIASLPARIYNLILEVQRLSADTFAT